MDLILSLRLLADLNVPGAIKSGSRDGNKFRAGLRRGLADQSEGIGLRIEEELIRGQVVRRRGGGADENCQTDC